MRFNKTVCVAIESVPMYVPTPHYQPRQFTLSHRDWNGLSQAEWRSERNTEHLNRPKTRISKTEALKRLKRVTALRMQADRDFTEQVDEYFNH